MIKQETMIVNLEHALGAFAAENLKAPEGSKIIKCEHLVDPVKGKVIYTLLVEYEDTSTDDAL